MMEYIIIAVLIAAACVLGVVTFGRSILYGFDLLGLSASGDSQKAAEAQKVYRSQLEQNSKAASDYHDSMHTLGDVE